MACIYIKRSCQGSNVLEGIIKPVSYVQNAISLVSIGLSLDEKRNYTVKRVETEKREELTET